MSGLVVFREKEKVNVYDNTGDLLERIFSVGGIAETSIITTDGNLVIAGIHSTEKEMFVVTKYRVIRGWTRPAEKMWQHPIIHLEDEYKTMKMKVIELGDENLVLHVHTILHAMFTLLDGRTGDALRRIHRKNNVASEVCKIGYGHFAMNFTEIARERILFFTNKGDCIGEAQNEDRSPVQFGNGTPGFVYMVSPNTQSPSNTYVYVGLETEGAMYKYNPSELPVISRAWRGTYIDPQKSMFNPTGDFFVYLSRWGEIKIYLSRDGTLIRDTKIGKNIGHMAFSMHGSRIHFKSYTGNKLFLFYMPWAKQTLSLASSIDPTSMEITEAFQAIFSRIKRLFFL